MLNVFRLEHGKYLPEIVSDILAECQFHKGYNLQILCKLLTTLSLNSMQKYQVAKYLSGVKHKLY